MNTVQIGQVSAWVTASTYQSPLITAVEAAAKTQNKPGVLKPELAQTISQPAKLDETGCRAKTKIHYRCIKHELWFYQSRVLPMNLIFFWNRWWVERVKAKHRGSRLPCNTSRSRASRQQVLKQLVMVVSRATKP